MRSVLEQTVASRVVLAESLLSTEVTAYDEVENARVTDKVSLIDGELREHALAAARAAAARDREMPTIQAALDAVRAELGDPGHPLAPEAAPGASADSTAAPRPTAGGGGF